MKFIALISFLIVFVTIVLSSSSSGSSLDVYYVNFVPYANGACNSNTPYGMGFSFIANQCLQDIVAFGTETESNVYEFQVNSPYEVNILASPPSPTCQQLPTPIQYSFTNGSCVILPKFTTFDGTYSGLDNFQYAQVIISNSPIYYQNQVYFRLFREGSCNDYPTYTLSITDSLLVSYATRATSYQCIDNNIYANNCSVPGPDFHCNREPLPEGTCFGKNQNNYEQIYCPPFVAP